MGTEGRLRIGRRVRHLDLGIGAGTIVGDNGDPEDRGAYLVRYDSGAEFQTSRSVLEPLHEEEAGPERV